MFVSATILTTIFLFVLFYCVKTIKQHYFCLISISKLPGPPVNDIITGNILPLYDTAENIFKTVRKWSRRYYPIYKLNAIHLATANVLSPEDCELILSNPVHMEKSPLYNLMHDWLGTGLLTSTGSKWQTRRKILTPAFHFSILQQFITIFNEETENLVEVLKKECHKPYVNVNEHIAQFTLKTIAETAMGTKLEFNTRKEIVYKKSVFDIGELYLYRLMRIWLLYKFIYLFNPRFYIERTITKRLHRFTRGVIAEHQRNFNGVLLPSEENENVVYAGKKRLAMLDLLLTAKNQEKIIDDEGIREEVDTFMFEGHDTTAAALGFSLMLIASHKNVQELIVKEMSQVLGNIHKKPTYNDFHEMKYLERTIKEVLRLYPSVHFISRKLGEDLVTHSGYYLAKGSMVNLHIYDLHHNPDIYPDPEKFDPDRFLPENVAKRHPFAYLPFSAGPRNCIGKKFAMLELKAAICGILANFILKPIDIPSTIVLAVDLVLRTKEGIKVQFVPRTQLM